MTGGRKTAGDQIGECASQVKHRNAGFHHFGYDLAALCLLCLRKRQLPGVRIRGMKIEGNSADVRRISGDQTDMAHSIFVDAVDSHVKTDIVRGCVLNVLHDGVVGITANGVVPLAITVQTEQNQVSFRKLERKSAVGDNIEALFADRQERSENPFSLLR